MIEKIQNFLEQEHTPLEKGLLISVALLSGIMIGFLFSPIKKGIKVCSENGNGNGCNDNPKISSPISKLKKDKKTNSDFKMFTLDEKQASE